MGTSTRDHDGAATMSGRRVRVFPSSDTAFHSAVLVAVGLVGDGDRVGEQLEAHLRQEFEGVRVVEQSELGAAFEAPCLYVFRDGSVLPLAGDGPGTPRYIPPLVVQQRTVARNLIARNRSAALLISSARAIERSREVRAMSITSSLQP